MKRQNKDGLSPYGWDLRGLTHKESDDILEASRMSRKQQRRRADNKFGKAVPQLPLLQILRLVLWTWQELCVPDSSNLSLQAA